MAEDLSLPKATVQKIIKSALPSNVRCDPATVDTVLECCAEFIHMISSEANDACAKDNKKTIAAEHVLSSLKELGFEHYVKEVNETYMEHKAQSSERTKCSRKLDKLGIPEEELWRQQEELFMKARSSLASSQDSLAMLQAAGCGPGPGSTTNAGCKGGGG
eukprot:CAMPEP_0177658780 /NCGR_PEP_ID=MMETSP0447-20121125/17048_1 /TAXON_ID=0 /ORGANISM="Stygamoeba regulata, Strain BSH-02190019" /LENGTH=160 /DNA_ID=CAMNT_0019163519 /DNA_START=325 /DNA_END=803 /DNA_ORIENTATION=+